MFFVCGVGGSGVDTGQRGQTSRKMGTKRDEAIARAQADAWTGDAVLGLFVREWILENHDKVDGEIFGRFTSNATLAEFGNPTAVEAEIGRVYEEGGLEAAYALLREKHLPAFLRREKTFQNSLQQRAAAKSQRSKRSRWRR